MTTSVFKNKTLKFDYPVLQKMFNINSILSLQNEKTLPLLITSNQEVSLSHLISENKKELEAKLRQHGSIVFKDFGVKSILQFEQIAEMLCDKLYIKYGDLPPSNGSKKIYGVTPYPANMTIHFHNEASHTSEFPLKQLFYCVNTASQGGGLRVVDGRAVLEKLPKSIVNEFIKKKLRYRRNFIPYLDVKWQDFFKTTDKSILESICRNDSIDFNWKGDVFCTSRLAPAVIKHPVTKQLVWFNQIQLHHPYMLEKDDYDAFKLRYEETDFPRYVSFGDSTPIPQETLSIISNTLEQESITIQAQVGDIIYNDNLLVAHSRLPYKGTREVRVALGDPINVSDYVLCPK